MVFQITRRGRTCSGSTIIDGARSRFGIFLKKGGRSFPLRASLFVMNTDDVWDCMYPSGVRDNTRTKDPRHFSSRPDPSRQQPAELEFAWLSIWELPNDERFRLAAASGAVSTAWVAKR